MGKDPTTDKTYCIPLVCQITERHGGDTGSISSDNLSLYDTRQQAMGSHYNDEQD
jgi:hypothetical protein